MREILQRAQHCLGLLAASLVNLLDPDCVVIGGGIADRLKDEFLEPIRATATRHILRAPHLEPVRIVPSRLGDHAGSVGAAVIGWNRLAGINPADFRDSPGGPAPGLKTSQLPTLQFCFGSRSGWR